MSFTGKHGPLLIAEIGGNHEGDFEKALEQTHLAILSGADVIKFQLYTGETLVSSVEGPDRHAHFKRFELSKEQHIQLARMVLDAGLIYTASVWDETMIEWIDPYMSFYKIGSGDVTAYPLLDTIARIGKPIILSTGLCTEEEVLACVDYIQSCNPIYKDAQHLALLQCTSMYPISPADAHLNVMYRLKELTGLTIGYSNHVEGTYALEIAAAMGASILEFHFTESREGKQFRDHKLSLTCNEVQQLIEKIKTIQRLQGSATKQVLPIEIAHNHPISFRRAVYP
ncbi:MAG: N-acetylneuraminate synthase, partial [Chitinophagaceae bacterium]|nr:N-acetylneuraminate synthase [Chitinophagaceae bacterium]